MTDSNSGAVSKIICLDSSAWLAYYFAENNEVKEIVDGSVLVMTSSLCLFEVKKRLLILKKDFKVLLDFIKQRGEIVFPDVVIVERAAEFAVEKKLGAMDALIYATSVGCRAKLISGDNDFRGLEGVRIIS